MGYSPWGRKESGTTERLHFHFQKEVYTHLGFPGGSADKESTCNAGDPNSIPGLERSSGEGDRLPTPVFLGFPGGSDGKESACNAGDLGLIPELGRFSGREHGNPLQHSCCRKGDSFQGTEVGSCLILRIKFSKETHVLIKQKILLGGGCAWVESRRMREPRRTAVTWLAASRFTVMVLISGLSLANHSDSESFLVAHALLSQDGCQQEGFLEVVRHMVSPFDLSQILPVGGGLLVLCSLPGPPVVKQLMQMFTMVPGQCGRFQSVCFLYHSLLENPHGQKSLAGHSP